MYVLYAVNIVLLYTESEAEEGLQKVKNWYSGRLEVEHVNQVGHPSKTPLNLLEIKGIGPVDTAESK